MSNHQKRRHERRSPSPIRKKRPYEIRFEKYKSKLNKIFFRDEDFIQVGTKEYKDFWKFLDKYQKFQKMKAAVKKPSSYNKRLTQSFKLCPKDPKDLLNRIAFQDRDYDDDILTEDMVSEFQTTLTLYIDFLQKEKFNKLKKLRQSQANLPIFEFKQEILETLEQNQVIIIAGDTGKIAVPMYVHTYCSFVSFQVVANQHKYPNIY